MPAALSAALRQGMREVLEHRAQGRWAQAQERMQALAGPAQADAAASAALGDFASALGDYALAFAAYDRAVALRPERSRYWFNRAAVRRFLGQIALAEADYDQCLELDPGDAQAWLNRADLRVQTPERNHVAGLQQRLGRAPLSWQDEVRLRYALAKELEDLGESQAAWSHLAAGAALRRRHLRYDPAEDLNTVDWLIEAFASERVPHAPAADAAAPTPIFIVGMPRTGSTLVDRMLGSHSQVFSAGELSDLGNAVVDAARRVLGRSASRRELVAASVRADAAALGADYLARARPHTEPLMRGERHFTDKMPLNYLYCPLIDAALPQARIVHVSRHPMATCYGMFKVLFDQGYPFSYDLDEIANHYIGYRRLIAHWHTVMPGRILEVSYEQLVADPAGQCRRLLDALGLPWEDGCLDFPNNPAPTATASATQVRRPIYASALHQWRRYAAQLEPLRQRLEAAGIDTGDTPISA
jgi:tetratricopeptide (TPR) repeat protein